MGAAEWAAGLDIGNPAEGMDAELLNRLRRSVAAADEDSVDGSRRACGAREEFAEEVSEGDAEEVAVGRGPW